MTPEAADSLTSAAANAGYANPADNPFAPKVAASMRFDFRLTLVVMPTAPGAVTQGGWWILTTPLRCTDSDRPYRSQGT